MAVRGGDLLRISTAASKRRYEVSPMSLVAQAQHIEFKTFPRVSNTKFVSRAFTIRPRQASPSSRAPSYPSTCPRRATLGPVRALARRVASPRREPFKDAALPIKLVLVQIVPDVIDFEMVIRQTSSEKVQREDR